MIVFVYHGWGVLRPGSAASTGKKGLISMASSKEYLEFILEQLSGLDGISFRPMMGEYILYYRGRIFGGIYDDRLLVKPVPAALSIMPSARRELPYDGAKEMLLVDEVEDKAFLKDLIKRMHSELPPPKRQRCIKRLDIS